MYVCTYVHVYKIMEMVPEIMGVIEIKPRYRPNLHSTYGAFVKAFCKNYIVVRRRSCSNDSIHN